MMLEQESADIVMSFRDKSLENATTLYLQMQKIIFSRFETVLSVTFIKISDDVKYIFLFTL